MATIHAASAPKAGTRVQRQSTPGTMLAAAIDRFGGPEVLSVRKLPVPKLDAGEVLIALHTSGVGSWDADIRSGWWPGPDRPRFPLVLGTDGAGFVAALGSGVRRFKAGEHVYSYSWMNPKGGFYAEFVAVKSDNVARVPARMTRRAAGAMPVIALTALQGLDDALHVRRTESIIIHGASGGVGTMAVQVAKLRGARVFATASGREGVELVLNLGAAAAINGHTQDITARAREFAPDGVDAILALAGGDALERCIDALHRGGRVAYPNGIEPEPKRRAAISIVSYDATPGVREFQRLNRAIESMRLKVPIAAAFSLSEAADAHRRLAQGRVLGKVILEIQDDD